MRFLVVFTIVFIGTTSSCSKRFNLNLSKEEAKALDTIYYQRQNLKILHTEWVFREKNICEYSEFFLRKKTYTCTWSEKGDSLYLHFFYRNKNAPIDQVIAKDALIKK